MSDHGANPIFFNNKKRLDVQNTPYLPPPTSENISFLSYPRPPSPHPLKVDVMCVSPLNKVSWRNTVFQRLQEANLCPKVSFACVLNFLIT